MRFRGFSSGWGMIIAGIGTVVLASLPAEAASVASLSASSLAQAGRLKITGTGFGAAPGTVLIGGAPAPIARWTDASITAYVPDSAPLGTVKVEVLAGGSSAVSPAPLTVTSRTQGTGRVRWRLELDAGTAGNPVVAPDGTIYVSDGIRNVYALTATGGVKWISSKWGANSLAVGSDGTLYVGSGPRLSAVQPDGIQKWQITDPTNTSIHAGPDVGPDGNVYAAFINTYPGSGSLGIVVVSPSGQILSRQDAVREYGAAATIRSFSFSAAQAFVPYGINDVSDQGLTALRLGGGTNWFNSSGRGLRASVGPDGRIYARTNATSQIAAFSPSNGAIAQSYLADGTMTTDPVVGSDGVVYAGYNYSYLAAVSSSGASKFRTLLPGIDIPVAPSVAKSARLITAGGYRVGYNPGQLHGVSPSGSILWSFSLPAQGELVYRPTSAGSFAGDETTLYASFAPNYDTSLAHLYSIHTGLSACAGCTSAPAPTPSTSPSPVSPAIDTVSISQAQYMSSKRQLRVSAGSSDASASLTVHVASTGQLIGTLKGDGTGRYSGQFTWTSNPGSITVMSSRGGSATARVSTK